MESITVNENIEIYRFSAYEVLIVESFHNREDEWHVHYVHWDPEVSQFKDHGKLQFYICSYPQQFGGILLDYVFYYQDYEFLSLVLNSGKYDSLIDFLIEYAASYNYSEIAILLVQYSNSIQASRQFVL